MELENLLERLKLDHLENQLDAVCEQASQRQLNYKDFLVQALQTEWQGRFQRNVEARLKLARFPWLKTLDQFEFEFQPSLDRKQVRELIRKAAIGQPRSRPRRPCRNADQDLGSPAGLPASSESAILAGWSVQCLGDEGCGNQIVGFDSALAALHDGRDLSEGVEFTLGNLGVAHPLVEVSHAHSERLGRSNLTI